MIRLRGVSHHYVTTKRRGLRWEQHRVRSVDDLHLEVRRGEVVGLLGRNGAGKSTTVKLLAGILTPSSGQVRVGDLDPARQRQENNLQQGVLFGQRSRLWWDLPVFDSYRMLSHLYRLEKADFDQRIKQLSGRLGLENLLDRPLRELSLGQRIRVELAGVLLHNPAYLFLDEPTIGLDPLVRDGVFQVILDHVARYQTTVFITSHHMGDIEALCSRILLIEEGRLVFDGTQETFLRTVGLQREVRVRVSRPDMVTAKIEDLAHAGDNWLAFAVGPEEGEVIGETLKSIAALTEIVDVEIRAPSMDDAVKAVYAAAGDHSRAGPS